VRVCVCVCVYVCVCVCVCVYAHKPNNICKLACSEWNENTFFSFRPVYPQQRILPTGLYSRILNYKDNILLPLNSDKKNYISGAVSGTKLSVVNVFNYEFPTQIECFFIFR